MKYTIISLIFALVFIACGDKTLKDLTKNAKIFHLGDPELFDWVISHTYGELDPQGTVEVQLGEKGLEYFKNQGIEDGELKLCPLIISPKHSYQCFKKQNKIILQSDEGFDSGQIYDLAVDLSFFGEFKNSYVKWQQRVPEQDFQITLEPLIAWPDGKGFILKGIIQTSVLLSRQDIESKLTAESNQKHLIKWTESDSISKIFPFEISQLASKMVEYPVRLTMSADGFDREEDWTHIIKIPKQKKFDVLDSRWVPGPNPHILISFTKPLNKKQNLKGLVTVSGLTNLIKEGSQLKLFTNQRRMSSMTVRVSPKVKDINGDQLVNARKLKIQRTAKKPFIKMIDKGNILPSRGEEAHVYFEAQALKKIRLKVLKVHEDNMIQHLQVNQLGTWKEMRRTGETMMDTLVDLKAMSSFGKMKYGIDVDSIMRASQGALLHFELSYDPSMIDYSCADSTFIQDYQPPVEGAEQSFWDYSGYGYWWENENNPCHPAYYNSHKIKVAKNIIASDLGIIAKTSDQQKILVSVRDILSAKPSAGTWVRLKNFQGRTIAEAKTDGEGLVVFDSQEKIFVIEAQKGDDRNYLKLKNNHQLAISDFDIQGSKASKGVQVFQYGERGVWRPGDTLYLTAIIHDPNKELPPALGVKMDIRNPQGNRIQNTVLRQSLNGFYHWKVSTDPQAETGNYTWNLRVAGKVFTKNLKIAAIKPNRLKVALSFSDSTESVVQSGDQVELSSRYLHGASAAGLQARLYLTTSPQSTMIPKSSAYQFDDLVRKYSGDKDMLWSGYLDNQGKQNIQLAFKNFEGAPGQLKAYFEAEVSESGGQSVRYESKVIHPYDTYLGLKMPPGDRARNMLLTDKDHQIEIVARTPQGQGVRASRVEMKFYKLSWKWWWHKQDDLNFLNSASTRLLKEEIIDVNKKTHWNIHVKYPDWGRYLVRACDLEGGHCSSKIVYIDWPGWAGRAQSGEVSGPQILAFSSDKKKYQVGETIKLKVPSSHQGYFWLSLENGSRVLSHTWHKAQKGENKLEIKIPAGTSPNAYVSVVLIQPSQGRKNDLPVRLYGVIPVNIEDQSTLLHPEISHAKVFKPNTKVKVKVSERRGQAMTYTLAMVDEGLLDLTNFKTPNPHSEFYKKQTLGIRTYDLYDDLIGIYQGNLDHFLAIGGGGSNRSRKGVKRFKPMVRFVGPFHLKEGDSKTHEIDLPSYVGSVKLMVVAGDRRSKVFGQAESVVPVRQDIMIQGTLPRVIGPDETTSMALQIFNMTDDLRKVNWNLSEHPDMMALGKTSGSLKLGAKKDTIIRVPLQAKHLIKSTHVQFQAKSGNDISKDRIDFEIRTPTTLLRTSDSKVLKPGEKFELKGQLEGFENHQKLTLNMSQGEPLYMEDHLQRLIKYPHGCVEQTTSKAFPQLFLEDLTELTSAEKIRIDDHINAAIAKLEKYQTPAGLLSYWPGQNRPADWASIYVAHFLTEAKKLGYVVNDSFYNRLMNSLRKVANRWRESASRTYQAQDLREQAYRLYVLSLASKAPAAALNRLYESGQLDGEVSWLMAAAFFHKGRKDLTQKILQDKKVDLLFGDEFDPHSYGSSLRDQAMILSLASQLGDEETAFKLSRAMVQKISSKRYLSTHESSWSLMALAQWQKKYIQGKTLSVELDGNGLTTQKPTLKKELNVHQGKYKHTIKNVGDGSLYVQWVKEYHPREEKPHQKGLRIKESYLNLAGKNLNPKSLISGEDVILELKVENTSGKRLDHVALTKMIPSGWEFLQIPQVNRGVDYQDMRDDQIHYYFNLSKGQTITIQVPLKASYVGKYFMSGALAESMYQMDIQAKLAGVWVEIK